MSFDLFLLFLSATLTFAVMPGPAVIYVVARTLAEGRAAGLWASLGVHLGGYVHVFAAVAGLSILLHAIPLLYTALKLVGAAYLVWIGIALIRTRSTSASVSMLQSERRSFWQSALVEVLNPKAALFYLAFLPQFTTTDAGLSIPLQLLALGIIVNLAFSLADVFYVLAADGLHRRLARSGAVLWVQRTGGAILVALGFNLALSRT